MVVTLTGSDGLFTRLGKIFQIVDDIIAHQAGGANSLDTQIEDVFDEYSSADQDMIALLADYTLTAQLQAGSFNTRLYQSAAQTIIDMVNDDNPQPDNTLNTALRELILQMTDNSDSVNAENPSIGGLTAGASNTGDGTIKVSMTDREGNGLQNVRPESLVFTCTRDAQVTGTAGQETFTARGEVAVPDVANPNWPGGSGYNAQIRVSDPAENGQRAVGRNLLTNSAFETFTVTDTPDNWTISVGAVSTDVFEEGTIVYRGSKCLELKGDGSTLIKLEQTFDGQTAGILRPQSRYLFSFRNSADAGMVAGALRCSIKDSGNNIVNSMSVTVDLTAASTGGTFDLINLFVATPLLLPDGLKFVIENTTAQTNTISTYIDDLMFVEAHQVGVAGPFFVMVPGATPFIIDDLFTQVVSNTYTGEFLKHFDRGFNTYSSALVIPGNTAGGETVPDSLIS